MSDRVAHDRDGSVGPGQPPGGPGGGSGGESAEPRGGRSSLLRSSGVMALGTVVSRVTGFIRNIVMVAALGTAIFADTYNVANTVPNILYILLVGGALNSVFVPQIVRAMREDKDGGQAYADRLLTATAVVLAVLTVAAVLAAPLLIRLYGRGFTGDDLSLSIAFARYCLPQIFFYGLYVMLGQVLNARDRFGPMMWSPILNNVVGIATFGLFMAVVHADELNSSTISGGETRLLGIGTTLGVAVQALALLPFLRATGFRWRPRFDWKGVGLGKAAQLAKWTILLVLTNQVGYAVIVGLATATAKAAEQDQIGYGVGYTPYTTAYLLFQLPHSIITVSIVTALLPRMSRAAAEGRLTGVQEDVSYGLRITAVAIVPAAVALFVMAPQLTTVMYLHGDQMSRSGARFIGYVLMGFAVGLVPFSAHHLTLRGFYALEDTRTPFFISIWIVATNVALAVIAYAVLPTRWTVVGMAVSFSAAYVVGLAISLNILRRRLGGIDGRRVVRSYVRLSLASVAAGLLALVLVRVCVALIGGGVAGSLAAVGVGGLAMTATYLLAAHRMRIPELTALIGVVGGRLRRSRSG